MTLSYQNYYNHYHHHNHNHQSQATILKLPETASSTTILSSPSSRIRIGAGSRNSRQILENSSSPLPDLLPAALASSVSNHTGSNTPHQPNKGVEKILQYQEDFSWITHKSDPDHELSNIFMPRSSATLDSSLSKSPNLSSSSLCEDDSGETSPLCEETFRNNRENYFNVENEGASPPNSMELLEEAHEKRFCCIVATMRLTLQLQSILRGKNMKISMLSLFHYISN